MRLGALTMILVFGLVAIADEPGELRLIFRPEAFKTLVNPNCSHCIDEAKRRAGELQGNDRVLAWIRGYSDGGAIPHRFFLNSYRVISDTYGVFVYDPDAGYSRGFAPSLQFSFHGWRNGVMVIQHKDGTLYSGLSGVAFAGPRKGDRLKAAPTLVTDWKLWLDRYPGGVAYQMFEKYQPVELPTKVDGDSLKSRGPSDQRLPEETLVLGVSVGEHTKAYPLEMLAKAGVLHDELNGNALSVLWYGPTRTAVAYRPVATPPAKTAGEPKSVSIRLATDKSTAPFVDEETGSRWDIAGRAVEGKLKGWTLEWLDSTQVKWFAWAAEYPTTTIYKEPESR